MNRLLIEKEDIGWHVSRVFDDGMSEGQAMAYFECLVEEIQAALRAMKNSVMVDIE